ncbi:hypothetical protein PCL1606_43370 [Pseudomonas chlororaphis]|uniref:Uncharacterized protein n=1 Tax=Pseudomonas chlororaphis TaxID=587753 RepID=A0A0D5Y472_9PSED|nr:hypothetical protein PCL1606_43370 [Pseudomonas chlororaphis]
MAKSYVTVVFRMVDVDLVPPWQASFTRAGPHRATASDRRGATVDR